MLRAALGSALYLGLIVLLSLGIAIQATAGLTSLPLNPWTGLGVLAVWTAGALLAGVALLILRDA